MSASVRSDTTSATGEDVRMQLDPKWASNGWGYRVSSQDQAFRAITRIGSLATGRRYVWRGSNNASYRVRSSLLRSLIEPGSTELPSELRMRQRELAILREAREWGLGLENGALTTDLHLLANLQHHGVATRLLDVTTNPMTALWFACQPNGAGQQKSCVIYAFDVTDLTEYRTIGGGEPTYGSLGDPLGWTLRVALAESARQGQPFLIRPSVPDARMQAQEGLFIAGVMPETQSVAGVDGLPMPTAMPPGVDRLAALFAPEERKAGRPRALPFCAVVIPADIKAKMLRHLEGTFNRRRSTIYPDLDGFRDAMDSRMVDLTPPPGVISAFEDDAARPALT
jgi:hypothetical protein